MSTQVGSNVELSKEGSILTIRVDLDQTFGRSSSGKSTIVATTGGFVQFEGVGIGLNVVKK